MHVLEQPPYVKPAERVTFTDVPGRSGSLTTIQGEDVYDDTIRTAQCIIANPAYIPALCGWLKGSGKVMFANRPDGFYYAHIVNQIEFDKILRGNPHRSFVVNFRCKPFWYKNNANNVDTISITSSPSSIINPGSVYSEPIIKVTGTGDNVLMVGLQIIELVNNPGNIVIDTSRMESYSGSKNLNSSMRGEYPILKPGTNAISWTGNVTNLNIIPNWRFL